VRTVILTRTHDFHAIAVYDALLDRGVACHIVSTDDLATKGGISWSVKGDVCGACISDAEGQHLTLRDIDLVWWRRLTGIARLPESLCDEAARDLVVRECRTALFGIFLTQFRGRWVSRPDATHLAENKLYQLDSASRCGLKIPRTLVSQEPSIVRRFCEELDYRVVVKPLAGTPKTPILAGRITPTMVASDEAVSLCPAIYQELVEGNEHLRVCCFGDEVYTALLRTERLDWRYPLDAHCEPFNLDPTMARLLGDVLADLGLRMGIFDLKLNPLGEPVWLELNPQGQFLFLEGMCGLPLTEAFASFLISEAQK
jgi:hypothetical protein